jgi:hypothetical protein
MTSSNVIIAEGALKKLNDILEGYKRPLIVSDVVIYDKQVRANDGEYC